MSRVAIARIHYEIEQAIESSGMGFTHLRPYAFMQNLLFLARTIVPWRAFFGITGDAPLNLVAARDIAAVAAVALSEPGVRNRGQAYVLTGSEALSYPALARRLSVAAGSRMTYVNQSADEMRVGLSRAHIEPWLIEHLVEIQQMTLARPETSNDVVARVTGRPPRSLDAFLAESVPAFEGQRSLGDRAVGWWLTRQARAV